MDASADTSAALDGLNAAEREAYVAFVRIADDADRAAAITAWARPRGTLRQPFTDLRMEAVDRARQKAELEGRKLKWLANYIGFSPTRLTRLSRKASTEGAAA